jgi:lipopolysaccharide transport system permease protein
MDFPGTLDRESSRAALVRPPDHGLVAVQSKGSNQMVLGSPLANWPLLREMVKREIVGRYRGSFGGVVWLFLQPLLMLLVYASVFGGILKSRWGGADSHSEFALVLFSGLMVFNIFGECLGRAPGLVVGRPNLVTKVVFPLDLLAWVSVSSAVFQFFASLIAWIVIAMAVGLTFSPNVIWLPVILLPVVFMALGIGWLFGSLGVFVRDLSQAVGPLTAALMFLTPIFYDLSLVPEKYRWLFAANPLTFPVEQARAAMLRGVAPDLEGLGIALFATGLFAFFSHAFFQRLRPEFADAL